MIATGGLLRINARRQDSLKSKTQKAQTHKRKSKKRRSEVVVVKGKLKLISVSGLVAALGILVLLAGLLMAALGYWPRDGLFFRPRPQEGATVASVSLSSFTPAPTDLQGEAGNKGGEGDDDGVGGEEEGHDDDGFNQTGTLNATTQHLRRGFLRNFLDRYLYSDRLKVLGPLIMGIGIFLFICANAVLHENRDKKTKVINLRDIYSTVIDLHNHRANSASARRSSATPLNGLINYVQSTSLETKPRVYPASLRREMGGSGEGGGGLPAGQQSSGGEGGGGGGAAGGGDDGVTVFTVYQEHTDAPATPPSAHRFSLLPSTSPIHPSPNWTSLKREVLGTSTLPLRRPQPPAAPRRRHSARAETGYGWRGCEGGEQEHSREEGRHRQDREEQQDECPPPPLSSSTPPTLRLLLGSYSSCSLHRDAPGGSQALLLRSSSSLTPSHLSLSSLSHLLSSSSATPPPTCRRRSLPSAAVVAGYCKLTYSEDESFDSITSSHHVTPLHTEVTSYRKCSNRKTLRRISKDDPGLRREEGEAGGGDGRANQELTAQF